MAGETSSVSLNQSPIEQRTEDLISYMRAFACSIRASSSWPADTAVLRSNLEVILVATSDSTHYNTQAKIKAYASSPPLQSF